jgi:hypothetical protein
MPHSPLYSSMPLTNWIRVTFKDAMSKVYHRSVFTIGLIVLKMLNLLTSNSELKRPHPNSLRNLSKVIEENHSMKEYAK